MFIAALDDAELTVQLTALQALRGVTDARLLDVFERLLQQAKTDQSEMKQTPIEHNVPIRLTCPDCRESELKATFFMDWD